MKQFNNSELFPSLPSTGSDAPFTQTSGTDFAEFMLHVNASHSADRTLAHDALIEVLSCDDLSRDTKLGALLMGSMHIATPEIIAGFTDAISSYEGRDLVGDKPNVKQHESDIIVGNAGSGKKGRKTMNISTAAMIVAAASEGKVLKAGSRSASSVTGSTDILEALGFKIPEETATSTKIFHETNFGFYSIEHSVPKFDRVYGGRFFAPHALSFVLPAVLIPVETDKLLYGYAGPDISLSARSFERLGYQSVMVCNNTLDGLHYIDEMTTRGTTAVTGVKNGVTGEVLRFDARQYMGIGSQSVPDIDSTENCADQKARFQEVIEGKAPDSIAENTVCLNAATLLYLGEVHATPQQAFQHAKDSIRTGNAAEKLASIIEASHDLR